MKENCPDTPVNIGLQHLENAYIIPAPCILCEDKIVKVQGIYDLVDFLDNGGLKVRSVEFFHAYMKGYNVVIVVLDMKNGELITRKHRLNNDILPCNWVLMEILQKYKDEELLEFEF